MKGFRLVIWSICLLTIITVIVGENIQKKEANQDSSAVYKVLPFADVMWEETDFVKGSAKVEKSVLWTNKDTGTSLFLLRTKDGFISSANSSNNQYYGFVISGAFNNEKTKESKDYLGPISYWHQNAQQSYIMASEGDFPIALIDEENLSDKQEKSKKIYSDEIIWQSSASVKGLEATTVWKNEENNQLNGSYIKMPFGLSGVIHNDSISLNAVVMQGKISYLNSSIPEVITLPQGSYFCSEGKAKHNISCNDKQGCVIYIRSYGHPNLQPYK